MEDGAYRISREEARKLYGNRNYWLGYLNIAFASAVTLVVLFLSRPTPSLLLVGLPLILLGEWFHTWGHAHLVKNVQLITSGPYARTQNPLYLGRLLMATGFLIAARLPYGINLVVLVAVYAIFFGYYMPRKTRVEGKRLRGFHGPDWEEYNRSVPVLIPSLRRYAKASDRRFSFEVLWRNREYYVYAAVLAALALLTWKTFG